MIPRRTQPLWTWVNDELSKPGKKWLLEDFILEDGVHIISGPPTTGYKSWTMYTMAMVLASGESRWGMSPTDAFPCWILQLESPGRPTAERFVRIKRGMNVETKAPIWMSHLSAHALDREGDVSELCQFIEQEGIRVLFVDTLAKARTRGSENSADDVGRLFQQVDRIRALGCATVFAHHQKKLGEYEQENLDDIDIDQIMRGSSAISGAYDLTIGVLPDRSGHDTRLRWIVRSNEDVQKQYSAQWIIQGDAETGTATLDLHPYDASFGAEMSIDRFTLALMPGQVYTWSRLQKIAGTSDEVLREMIDGLEIQQRLVRKGGGTRWEFVG